MTRPVQISRAPRWALALVATALVTFGLGCDRNTAPYVPGEPKQPDLSRIFPDAGEHDHAAEAAAERTNLAQETSRAGSAKGATIAGEIQLASSDAPAGATLFVIARKVGATGGPPLAVLRVPRPSFPFPFELSQANVMIPSLRFDGEMDVTARLDSDGNAMTKDAADLEGRAASPHVPGDSGVTITLQ